MKTYETLYIAIEAEYDAAVERSYKKLVESFCLSMTAAFFEIYGTPGAPDAWIQVVNGYIREVLRQTQGWTVSVILRERYLQPLRELGNVLKERLVS